MGAADTPVGSEMLLGGDGSPRVLGGALGVPKVSLSLLSKGVGDGSHARKTYRWPHVEDAHALLWSSAGNCPANDSFIKRGFGRTYPAQLGCFYRGLPAPPLGLVPFPPKGRGSCTHSASGPSLALLAALSPGHQRGVRALGAPGSAGRGDSTGRVRR